MVNSQPVIFVCNGKSCSRDGAKEILRKLRQNSQGKIKIQTKFCFGKCGNGPIIVVLPVEQWFYKTKLEHINCIWQNI